MIARVLECRRVPANTLSGCYLAEVHDADPLRAIAVFVVAIATVCPQTYDLESDYFNSAFMLFDTKIIEPDTLKNIIGLCANHWIVSQMYSCAAATLWLWSYEEVGNNKFRLYCRLIIASWAFM